MALHDPSTIMSITMDGKTPLHIPHFSRMPKSLFAKYRPKFHLWGLINYGIKQYDFFSHFDWWKHDPNLTMSFLWEHLSSVLKQRNSPLQTLYITADNCARENKNRWMFAFLSLLVHKGYTSEIQLHFLMAGHSHDKVCTSYFLISATHACFALFTNFNTLIG